MFGRLATVLCVAGVFAGSAGHAQTAGANVTGANVTGANVTSGPYVNLGLGANLLQSEPERASPVLATGRDRFDTGLGARAGVGYGFGNGFRVELDGGYRDDSLRRFGALGGAGTAHGRQRNYDAMVDVLFDLDVGSRWITPYFGGGAGYGWTRWDNIGGSAGAYAQTDTGGYGGFAYEGLFGLAFPVSYVPGLSLTAEYDFFSVLGPEGFHGSVADGASVPPSVARGNVDIVSDHNHSLMLGLRYALSPAAQPAMPVPAAAAPAAPPVPEAPRTYLVFFDWDRSDLSTRARQIIAEAASASTHTATTRIDVNGYTDLSGTAAYNQALSVRRARSVEAELVRDGVAQSEIAVRGLGEASPLVPTAKGVREPQNRRVEIVLH